MYLDLEHNRCKPVRRAGFVTSFESLGELLRAVRGFFCMGAVWLLVAASAQGFESQLLQELEGGSRLHAYQWLQGVEKDNTQDPAYYDWLGRFAMELGDYPGAIAALEKLIALEPRHMGARLDLVIALQLDGRSYEAREKLQDLNARLERHGAGQLPEQARRQLDELNGLLLANGQPMSKFSGSLTISGGHDSNANRGADRKTIFIELPGSLPLELELAPDSLKTADEFVQAELYGDFGQKGNGCQAHSCRLWMAGAMTRQYQHLDDFDQRLLYAGVRQNLSGPYRPEVTLVASNAIVSELDFEEVEEQNSFSAEYRQLVPGVHHLTVGIRGEVIDEKANDRGLSYLSTLELTGNLKWPWQRSFYSTNRRLLWALAGSWHQRPDYSAGNAQRIRLSLSYPFILSERIQGGVLASYQWREDSDAFSPLFFGDEVREEGEWLLNANLIYRLGSTWQLGGGVWYEQIDSSIALFDVTRFQFRLNLGYQF